MHLEEMEMQLVMIKNSGTAFSCPPSNNRVHSSHMASMVSGNVDGSPPKKVILEIL